MDAKSKRLFITNGVNNTIDIVDISDPSAPILSRQVNGKPLVYLDSANTSQKPQSVIRAVDAFYREHNANVSRAVHALGSEATEAYEGARRRLAAFVNVPADELILTSGTTFAINLVAYSWALPRLKAGDVILLTRMEHHANIVPWQLVCERTGASLRVVELAPDGSLDMDDLRAKLTGDVKLLAFTHVSNVLGTVNPVAEICREARRRGIPTLVDGSQALPHRAVDLKALGCDFYAFTGHKMLGPTGTGGLWARRQHLREMPPFLGGGEMIREVHFEGTTFNDPPHKFEAGTPNIAGVVGLGAAAAKKWRYVGYKGGSEPGVISMSYLLQSPAGKWYIASGSWNDTQQEIDKARFAALMERLVGVALN